MKIFKVIETPEGFKLVNHGVNCGTAQPGCIWPRCPTPRRRPARAEPIGQVIAEEEKIYQECKQARSERQRAGSECRWLRPSGGISVGRWIPYPTAFARAAGSGF